MLGKEGFYTFTCKSIMWGSVMVNGPREFINIRYIKIVINT